MKNLALAFTLGAALLAGGPQPVTEPVLDLDRWLQERHDRPGIVAVPQLQEEPPVDPICVPERGHCPIG